MRRNFLGKRVKESSKKNRRARGDGSTCWKAMEMMWKVVSVSSCFCEMLCSLALPNPVTVVNSCESEFVCHLCEPQRFISQTEESTFAVETARQPLAVTTALPPCLAKDSRCGSFLEVVLASLQYLGGSRRPALACVRLRKMVSPTKPSNRS